MAHYNFTFIKKLREIQFFYQILFFFLSNVLEHRETYKVYLIYYEYKCTYFTRNLIKLIAISVISCHKLFKLCAMHFYHT